MALTDNLVAYYKMDETTGTIVTDVVAAKNLTNTSASINQPGKIGTSYLFSSSSITKCVGSVTGVGENLSISFWCNILNPTSGSYQVIITKGTNSTNCFNVFIASSYWNIGKITFNIGEATPSVAAGWNFVVVTKDSSDNYQLFVNNIRVVNASMATSALSDNFGMGNRLDNNGDKFSGNIDEVGIWSRILTDAEISQLYNSGAGFAYPFVTPTPATTTRPLSGWISNDDRKRIKEHHIPREVRKEELKYLTMEPRIQWRNT